MVPASTSSRVLVVDDDQHDRQALADIVADLGYYCETAPDGEAASTVSVETTWNGAGGIGGFFERTFAPGGLRRIYDGVLANLDNAVRADS